MCRLASRGEGQTTHVPHNRESVPGATRSLGFNHIFTSPVLSTLLRVMALVARRRNSDARGLRACSPSAKGEIAPLRVGRREALISRLVRPVILYGIGRSRRQQRRKRRHCRSRNDDFSHDLSPSSLFRCACSRLLIRSPGCRALYIFALTKVSKIYVLATGDL